MGTHQKQVHLLMVGGHAATTALATVQKLQADDSIDWKISWVGPQKSIMGTNLAPFEVELFPRLGIKVYTIEAGKLQSKFTRHTIPALAKLPHGFWQAASLLKKLKPQVVLSFGGYAAFPVVVAASMMRIPVVLHEQTVAAGLANRLSSVFATKITLAREESKKFFGDRKSVVIGNPVMEQILNIEVNEKSDHLPTIYITGGSRGSQKINDIVFEVLPKLLPKYKIIHQTGQLDYDKAKSVKNNLSDKLAKNYEVYAFIDPMKIGEIYKKTSILIGRAGANTVSEVMTVGIPSILIPIPWTRMDEQTKNAKFAEKNGISVLLPENKLSATTFIETINLVNKNRKSMIALAKARNNIDRNASLALVEILASLTS